MILRSFTQADTVADLFVEESHKKAFSEALQARKALLDATVTILPVVCSSSSANPDLLNSVAQHMPLSSLS